MSVRRTFLTSVWVSLVASLFVSMWTHATYAQRCNLKAATSDGYEVRNVIYDPSLQKHQFDAIQLSATFPIKQGDILTQSVVSSAIQDRYVSILVNDSLIESAFLGIDLENCTSVGAKTLTDVRVHAYLLTGDTKRRGSAQFSAEKEVSSFSKVMRYFNPKPYAVYRGGSEIGVGSDFSLRVPGPVIRSFDLNAETAVKGFAGKASVERGFKVNKSLVEKVSLNGGYDYLDQPSNSLRLRRSEVFFQVSAGSKALRFGDTAGLNIEYGSVLERGILQTNVDPDTVPNHLMSNTNRKSLKFYFGGVFRSHRQTTKLGYGLQLGSTGSGFETDYAKHIFNAEHRHRISLGKRFSLSFEVSATAGNLQYLSKTVPISERFFGGNRRQYFIRGGSFDLLGAPLIRSVPGNQLYQTPDSEFLGADSFFSTNLTVAVRVWSIPLIPTEISEELTKTINDPAFTNNLRVVSLPSYIVVTPGYRVLVASVKFKDFSDALEKCETLLNSISSGNIGSETRTNVEAALEIVADAKEVIEDWELETEKTSIIRELAISTPNSAEAIKSSVGIVLTSSDSGLDPYRSELGEVVGTIDTLAGGMRNAYDTFANANDGLKLADKNVGDDISYMQSQFNVIIKGMDVFSISPAFIFDTAKMQTKDDRIISGGRFAVGPAVRAEVFGTQITFGYAFNPRRRLGEKKGSFTFSIDFTDLIR